MQIAIAPDVRLFVDIEGAGLVPDGATMRAQPTLVLLHGGPGYDHSGFKPAFLHGRRRADRVLRPPRSWPQ